jgi:peptidoglycan/LPS O-acetylase OafA/YrhL
MPVLVLLAHTWPEAMASGAIWIIWPLAASVAAIAFYRLVEKPSQDVGRRWAGSVTSGRSSASQPAMA